ncbi:MAG: flagellin [Methylococcales bacterium]
MAFSINSNNRFSSRAIDNAQKSQNEAMQRLSSMLRINSAKDDAAGSAIFQRQTATINGSNQAIRNANDGISFVQTAQGGLGEITSNLQRMRELAVQAANATTTNRGAIQAEVNQLSQQNTSLGGSSFGGQAIFPPSGDSISFQVGASSDSSNQISVNLESLDSLNSINSDQSGNTIDLSSAESAQLAIQQIDSDLAAVSKQASNFGSVENRLGVAISNTEEYSINTQASRGRIGDADIAKEVSKMIRAQVLEKASIFAAAQGNQSKKMVLSLLGGG